MKKKIQIAILSIIAVFVITNPSLKRFEEFAPSQYSSENVVREKFITSRINNYFLFSIFEVKVITRDGGYYYRQVGTYVGYLGNFYFIKNDKSPGADREKDL